MASLFDTRRYLTDFDSIRMGHVLTDTLVIGCGVAGLTAALNLADQVYDVTLIERETEVGGQARSLARTADGADVQAYLRQQIARVEEHPRIEVLLDHEVVKSSGFVGYFQSTVACGSDQTQRMIEHGITLVATGGQEHRGTAYGLGSDPRIITQGDLEQQLATGEGQGAPRSVVMLQCVGPWDEEESEADFYCSRK